MKKNKLLIKIEKLMACVGIVSVVLLFMLSVPLSYATIKAEMAGDYNDLFCGYGLYHTSLGIIMILFIVFLPLISFWFVSFFFDKLRKLEMEKPK